MPIKMKLFWSGTVLCFMAPAFIINKFSLWDSIFAIFGYYIIVSLFLIYFLLKVNFLSSISSAKRAIVVLLMVFFAGILAIFDQRFGFVFFLIWISILIDTGVTNYVDTA